MNSNFNFIVAKTKEQISNAVSLFQEYAASLNISLDFQNFEEELKVVESMYGQPEGLLILVYDDINPIACAAFRKLNPTVCEVKRMYVKPAYRKHFIGDRMMKILIEHAQSVGYKLMRLDTLDTMTPAISLYKKHGFYEIDAYYFNPNQIGRAHV